MSIDINLNPAGRTIKEKKVKLIECLMADADFVLQHVDQKSIVSRREYQNLKFPSGPQETVTRLLDLVLSKGPGKCGDFLQLLTDPEVLDTFPPLRDILDMTDQS
uniref:CARD domain-containing protein n=1 Tax=Poecilia reticulata TaxID=8081 RepID=A0A3P9Q8X8_POERE